MKGGDVVSEAKTETKAAEIPTLDPSTIDKKTFNENADDINKVVLTRSTKKPYLACGAASRNKRRGDICCMVAGQGTKHKGYGRCKYHGGNSTGPITEAGKERAKMNGTKHGFYSEALSAEERELYEEMVEKNVVNLDHEIYMLKVKILVYLKKWRQKWDATAEKEGADVADAKTKVLTKESEGNGHLTYSYYHAGTIEDKPLIRALETLGRLVDKHAKLNGGQEGDALVNQLNKELREASHGRVSIAWGERKPQTRTGGVDNE